MEKNRLVTWIEVKSHAADSVRKHCAKLGPGLNARDDDRFKIC